jgi:chorismate-pyruvate lyase
MLIHARELAVIGVLVSGMTLPPMSSVAQQCTSLAIEAKIPLGNTEGRIDHLGRRVRPDDGHAVCC